MITSSDLTLGVVLGVSFLLLLLFCLACVLIVTALRYSKRSSPSPRMEMGRVPSRYGNSHISQQPLILQELIGQGKFGQVYKAVYDERTVAVKTYSQHK